MSEKMQIKAQEHGLIRVFAIDMAAEDIEAFTRQSANGWPLQDALNASHLVADYIEVFDLADLDDLGLAGYMVQGLGVATADIAEMRPQLDALTGPVLILLSKAFGGKAQVLAPQAPLRWVCTFREEAARVQFTPLKSQAAKGNLAAPAPQKANNPHLTLLAAIVALPVVVGLLATLLWLVLR